MAPSFSAAVKLQLVKLLHGSASTKSCALCPYSPKLVNKVTLSECNESEREMKTWLQLEVRTKPAHPVQEDFDFLILFILYTAETFLQFWGVQSYFGFRK